MYEYQRFIWNSRKKPFARLLIEAIRYPKLLRVLLRLLYQGTRFLMIQYQTKIAPIIWFMMAIYRYKMDYKLWLIIGEWVGNEILQVNRQ